MEFPTVKNNKPSSFLKLLEDFGKIDTQPIAKMTPTISRKRRSHFGSFKVRKSTDSEKPQMISGNNIHGKNNPSSEINDSTNESWSQRLGWWQPPETWLPIEFCSNTSLHGLKYIGQPERHISERIFWLVAFGSGLMTASLLINDVWRKYNDSPVIVSFNPTETSVDQIPFPAVTICNMNKILKSKANAFISKAMGNNMSEEETTSALNDVYFLDHVCSVSKSFTKRFNFSNGRGEIDKYLMDLVLSRDIPPHGVTQFIRKAAQPCTDMLPGLCIWQDEFQRCSDIFRPIETEFGSCCTFNFIPQSLLHRYKNDSRDNPAEIKQWEAWKIEKRGLILEKDQDQQPFPRRQMLAGKNFGLSFALNPNLSEYYCTTSDSVGFRLLVHVPIDVARVSDFGIGIKPNSEVFIDVRPEITLAEKEIYGFSLVSEKRQCYYSGEISLKYYAYYSIANCIDECVANATYEECQCVHYHMPRDSSKDLCGPQNFTCAYETKRKLIKRGIGKSCPLCLPTCTEMGYTTDVTSTPLQQDFNIWERGSKNASWSNGNASIVHVYFGTDSFYPRVRKELFGITDLFSNTGGLMGLCLGFSGLSLMEVFYFLTLRAWCRDRFHIRALLAGKIKQLWRKTKAILKGNSENNRATLTHSDYDDENIMQTKSPNQFFTTVSINNEFARNEMMRIQYKTANFGGYYVIDRKRNNGTVDYSNVFGEINTFYKNN